MASCTFRYAVSWSGGKDSALALNRAWKALGEPAELLTMMIEDGTRSRSHGLRPELLALQAAGMNVPITRRATSWKEYEQHFVEELKRLRAEGVGAVVFGDIDLEDHRAWCVRVCASAGLAAIHPLWGEARQSLIDEFVLGGFHATLVAVRDKVLPTTLLGMDLQYPETRTEIVNHGADLCGENGEYHTVVTASPQLRQPIALSIGAPELHDGVWFVDATP